MMARARLFAPPPTSRQGGPRPQRPHPIARFASVSPTPGEGGFKFPIFRVRFGRGKMLARARADGVGRVILIYRDAVPGVALVETSLPQATIRHPFRVLIWRCAGEWLITN